MSRMYTAGEFRQIADAFEPRGVVARIHNGIGEREIFARDIVAMLRQAADLQDRDEREKEYEYGIDYTNKTNGNVCSNHHHFDSLKQAKRYATPLPDEEVRFVRRSVGEWGEVDDEE